MSSAHSRKELETQADNVLERVASTAKLHGLSSGVLDRDAFDTMYDTEVENFIQKQSGHKEEDFPILSADAVKYFMHVVEKHVSDAAKRAGKDDASIPRRVRHLYTECMDWLERNGFTAGWNGDVARFECYQTEGDPGNDMLLLRKSQRDASFIRNIETTSEYPTIMAILRWWW